MLLQKVKMDKDVKTFEFIVSEKPIKAGIAVSTCATEGGNFDTSSMYTPGVLVMIAILWVLDFTNGFLNKYYCLMVLSLLFQG